MAVHFRRRSKLKISVPTSSMPDIIFQLLIFFMVTTVLRQFDGLQVQLPDARQLEKMGSKRHIANIWIDKEDRIVLDERLIKNVTELRHLLYQRRVNDPKLIVSMKVDKEATMGIINKVQTELRKANALRVSYNSLPEPE